MSAAKTNKTSQVLKHLQKNGSITSWEAIQKYSATRLSAIIFNLRKHYIISSVMQEDTDRYGNNTRFARYVYQGEIPVKDDDAQADATK